MTAAVHPQLTPASVGRRRLDIQHSSLQPEQAAISLQHVHAEQVSGRCGMGLTRVTSSVVTRSGPTATSVTVTIGSQCEPNMPGELSPGIVASAEVYSSVSSWVRTAPVSTMKRYGLPATVPSTMTVAQPGSSGSASIISGTCGMRISIVARANEA